MAADIQGSAIELSDIQKNGTNRYSFIAAILPLVTGIVLHAIKDGNMQVSWADWYQISAVCHGLAAILVLACALSTMALQGTLNAFATATGRSAPYYGATLAGGKAFMGLEWGLFGVLLLLAFLVLWFEGLEEGADGAENANAGQGGGREDRDAGNDAGGDGDPDAGHNAGHGDGQLPQYNGGIGAGQ